MPALSQSLTFTVHSTNTVVLSYPNTEIGPLTFYSNRVKGDGYFSGGVGFHTIQIQTTDFVGNIEMEASLASEPSSSDWFRVELGTNFGQSVDTSGLSRWINITSVQYLSATTAVKTYNFKGNFIWVRAKISEFTEGTINSIKYNY